MTGTKKTVDGERKKEAEERAYQGVLLLLCNAPTGTVVCSLNYQTQTN